MYKYVGSYSEAVPVVCIHDRAMAVMWSSPASALLQSSPLSTHLARSLRAFRNSVFPRAATNDYFHNRLIGRLFKRFIDQSDYGIYLAVTL